jgi:DNA-binding XRE family transcriptional regulator
VQRGLPSRTRLPLPARELWQRFAGKWATAQLQRDVAEQIGVDKFSIANWEANASKPEIRYMPAIIRFLGYNPLPAATGLGERLVRCRTILGLTQKESAQRL